MKRTLRSMILTAGCLTALAMQNNLSAATFTVVFQQDLNGYVGTYDTYINEDSKDSSYGANGEFQADSNIKNDLKFRDAEGLLKFADIFTGGTVYEDATSLSVIPTTASITAATLSINCTNSGDGGTFYRMNTAWNESSTWNSLGSGTSGDRGASEGGFSGSGGWQNYNVLGALQAWIANASSNQGWAFVPGGSGDGTSYASSENGTLANRPKLTVTFNVELANLAPTLQSLSASQSNGLAVGQSITLSSLATDPGMDSLTYSWDLNQDGLFGDQTGNSISASFARAGRQSVTVRVSDGQGGQDERTIELVVRSQARLSGTGSSPLAVIDADKSILGYVPTAQVDIVDAAIGTIAWQFGFDPSTLVAANNQVYVALWLTGQPADWQTIVQDMAADGYQAILASDATAGQLDVMTQGFSRTADLLLRFDELTADSQNRLYFSWNLAGASVDQVALLPEPSALALLSLGGLSLLARRRSAR